MYKVNQIANIFCIRQINTSNVSPGLRSNSLSVSSSSMLFPLKYIDQLEVLGGVKLTPDLLLDVQHLHRCLPEGYNLQVVNTERMP